MLPSQETQLRLALCLSDAGKTLKQDRIRCFDCNVTAATDGNADIRGVRRNCVVDVVRVKSLVTLGLTIATRLTSIRPDIACWSISFRTSEGNVTLHSGREAELAALEGPFVLDGFDAFSSVCREWERDA